MKNKILFFLLGSVCADFVDLVFSRTCPDQDISEKCEGQCETEYINCTSGCSESNCLMECGRAFSGCVDDCPCHANCPNGCADCSNPICVCGENSSPQNKENLESCKNERSIDLGQCIIDCKNDRVCEDTCVDHFKIEYGECPCQTDCPFGCPCDAFDCEPDKKSVLVINTHNDSYEPKLIKFDGGKDNDFDFEMGPNTSAKYSCSAILNGEMFVFGGQESDSKQISKITDCSLKRIAELPHEFKYGACGTFKFSTEERVMFCFPDSGKNKCFSYNGEEYADHPDAINDHHKTSLGNIDNKVLAVGSHGNYGNTDVELFDIKTNTWTNQTSFPFCSSWISVYGVVNRDSSVLIIGGQCDGSSSSRIAKYTLDVWEHVGNLQHDRMGHRAISNDDRIYVVGGAGGFRTEIWSMDDNDNTVNMKIADPRLSNHAYYPELFLVDSDFCSKN